MTKLKEIRFTNYELLLPEDVREQYDGRVSSFWLEGNSLLLQLSSYVRDLGEQPTATERLLARLAKHSDKWIVWDHTIHSGRAVDQATAEFVDTNGVLWVHSYLVWPHLTVYAILSGTPESLRDQDSWATKAVGSIKLVLH